MSKDIGLKDKERGGEVINLDGIAFTWPRRSTPVLDISALQVERGEHLFIMGPSGSGKSTLLGLLAGVITPQEGTVSVLGKHLETLSGPTRDRFRANHIGYIFQLFNLIPYLSILENVTLPCRFSSVRAAKASARSGSVHSEAHRLLDHLSLGAEEILYQQVVELSVGQQQRVAAARALIGSPELVIADEPTSSLDTDQREAFIRLLFEECNDSATSLVFVSHDTTLAPLFDRTVNLDEINQVKSDPQTTKGATR